MKRLYKSILLFILAVTCVLQITCDGDNPDTYQVVELTRAPKIFPDYSDIVVPPNSAPLNFRIHETGKSFRVKVHFQDEDPLIIRSSRKKIQFPQKAWSRLLKRNRGRSFQIEVDVLDENRIWRRFKQIENRIAEEPIDGYLVYRRMMPIHNFWGSMGIYQRNLGNFEEKPLLLNRTIKNGCINCHIFYQNKPDRMVLHTRGRIGAGMLIAQGDSVIKVDTRTPFNNGPVVFRSWHPNGNILATSVNQFIQFFHATGESREVCDLSSDLLLYFFDNRSMSTVPSIASPDRMETFPCWTPDGRTLYFSSAPSIYSYRTEVSDDISTMYSRVRYDMKKIAYDPESGTWGELRTVLSSEETDRSVLMPKISPDGRTLLFCMADYGGFPVMLSSSDIYIMDLASGTYYKPDINSDQAESNYTWSSKSRWFVFCSKRLDGLTSQPYFCYVDGDGKASKPFLLPQEDPDFYDKCLDTFNVPEFVTGPVKTSWQDLARAAMDNDRMVRATLDPKVKVDAVSAASAKPTWLQPR